MIMFCVVMASLAITTMATLEDDEKECTELLTSLASCIPYVSGTAKKPTPECCQNAQNVKAKKPKCLCILIKESTDPSMGLPVNTTLALQMSSACNMDAKVANCPTLLKLSPDSPDAKIFKDADSDSSTTSTTNATPTPASNSSETSAPSSSTSGPSSDSKATTSNNDGLKVKFVESATLLLVMASFLLMFL
ncbi:LTP_2 domain-containing protein [Cephalotus follicularis]|uniref:LTP_2 domain-containing protein n=1 Tax=Cephalotus follicularis TaxID=3775 RepID=A0A1Q3D1E1_CEPFO|nr:LTP_2 domain-containing protein [Cephalotus follicularis]